MKKRILSLALALAMLLSLIPLTASAEELSGQCGENAIWSFSDGTLTISGEGKIDNYVFNPAPWADFQEEIMGLIIEEGITGGGNSAFAGLNNLRGVILPNTMTEIAENMFRNCGNLFSFTIPEGVTSIGPCAFFFCGGLRFVTIPSTVTTIGYYAFGNCPLESVILPEGVTTLEHCVFANNSSLRSVYIPLSMQAMSREWVRDCSNLRNIYYPGTQEQWEAIELTWADLPVGQPNPSLINATIHYNYTTTGKCGKNATFNLVDGVLTISGEGKVEQFPIPWESQKENITAVVVEEGITAIQNMAFMGCTNLVSVTLPEESCYFVGYTFSGCTSLKEVELPKYMIDPDATIPLQQVSRITAAMFENCTALESITIPASVEKIGETAFAGCTGLKEIYFLGDAPTYICADDPWEINGTTVIAASFNDVTATVYYPKDNPTWTEEVMQNYGGNLTWVPYDAPADLPFTDVVPGAFYEDAVAWAVEKGITNGRTETTFAPGEPCKRSEVVTFLFRSQGSPIDTAPIPPFSDVSSTAFYTIPVAWALEEGITNGMGDGTFGVDQNCTRAQVVTFLWRTAGCPEPSSTEHPFTDLNPDGFYYKAVLWAVEKGITKGMTATTFGVGEPCTRGQIVTFLHRFAG